MQYFSFPDISDGVSSSAIACPYKTKRVFYAMQREAGKVMSTYIFIFAEKKLLHSDKLIINLWRKRKALINDIFRTSSLQIIFEEWLCVRSKAVLLSRRVNIERPTFSLPDTLYFTIRLSRSCF